MPPKGWINPLTRAANERASSPFQGRDTTGELRMPSRNIIHCFHSEAAKTSPLTWCALIKSYCTIFPFPSLPNSLWVLQEKMRDKSNRHLPPNLKVDHDWASGTDLSCLSTLLKSHRQSSVFISVLDGKKRWRMAIKCLKITVFRSRQRAA